jgi:putative membrane protein
MQQHRYDHYDPEKMILRDHLALERTLLANERTFLAYVKTTAGIIALGGTIIKFFDGWVYLLTGWSFIILGVLVFVYGFSRYVTTQSLLEKIEDREQSVPHHSSHYLELFTEKIQYFPNYLVNKVRPH